MSFSINQNKALLLPIVLIFFQVAGFGRNIPWSYLPFQLGTLFWLLLTLFLIMWMMSSKWIPLPNVYSFLLSPLALRSWLLLNLLFSVFSYVHFKEFGYQLPWIHFFLIGVGFFFVRADRLFISFLFNLFFLCGSIVHFKIHPERSDMLPVIKMGLDRLKSGLDPYHPFIIFGSTKDIMGYLPGTFFLNWPAWALGLDLRWNTVFYRAIWMLLIWRAEKKEPKITRLTLLHYLALSPYLNFRHDLYFEGFLLIIVVYFLYPKLRPLFLSLGVFTRQWFWILSPFLIYREYLRQDKKIVKVLLTHALSFVLVFGLFFALLVGTTNKDTLLSSIFWFQGEAYSQFDYGIGLARIFYLLKINFLLQKFQGIWCTALFTFMVIKKPNLHQVWLWAWLAWFGFLLLNAHFWLYFWISFVLFSAVAPYADDDQGRQTARP